MSPNVIISDKGPAQPRSQADLRGAITDASGRILNPNQAQQSAGINTIAGANASRTSAGQTIVAGALQSGAKGEAMAAQALNAPAPKPQAALRPTIVQSQSTPDFLSGLRPSGALYPNVSPSSSFAPNTAGQVGAGGIEGVTSGQVVQALRQRQGGEKGDLFMILPGRQGTSVAFTGVTVQPKNSVAPEFRSQFGNTFTRSGFVPRAGQETITTTPQGTVPRPQPMTLAQDITAIRGFSKQFEQDLVLGGVGFAVSSVKGAGKLLYSGNDPLARPSAASQVPFLRPVTDRIDQALRTPQGISQDTDVRNFLTGVGMVAGGSIASTSGSFIEGALPRFGPFVISGASRAAAVGFGGLTAIQAISSGRPGLVIGSAVVQAGLFGLGVGNGADPVNPASQRAGIGFRNVVKEGFYGSEFTSDRPFNPLGKASGDIGDLPTTFPGTVEPGPYAQTTLSGGGISQQALAEALYGVRERPITQFAGRPLDVAERIGGGEARPSKQFPLQQKNPGRLLPSPDPLQNFELVTDAKVRTGVNPSTLRFDVEPRSAGKQSGLTDFGFGQPRGPRRVNFGGPNDLFKPILEEKPAVSSRASSPIEVGGGSKSATVLETVEEVPLLKEISTKQSEVGQAYLRRQPNLFSVRENAAPRRTLTPEAPRNTLPVNINTLRQQFVRSMRGGNGIFTQKKQKELFTIPSSSLAFVPAQKEESAQGSALASQNILANILGNVQAKARQQRTKTATASAEASTTANAEAMGQITSPIQAQQGALQLGLDVPVTLGGGSVNFRPPTITPEQSPPPPIRFNFPDDRDGAWYLRVPKRLLRTATKYQPSLTGILFGKTVKKEPKQVFGFEVRPIVGKKRRKGTLASFF